MRQSEWSAHISALNDSGLSARAYARNHDLVYSQLIYWKRKFANSETANSVQDGFVAVNLTDEQFPADCLGVLEFPTGVRLRIHRRELLAELAPYLGIPYRP